MVYFSLDHFFVSLVAFFSFMLILFPSWVFVMFFCEYLWSVSNSFSSFFFYTRCFFNSSPASFLPIKCFPSFDYLFFLCNIFIRIFISLLHMDIFSFAFRLQFFRLWFTYHHSHTYFIHNLILPPCWFFSFLLSPNYSSSSSIFSFLLCPSFLFIISFIFLLAIIYCLTYICKKYYGLSWISFITCRQNLLMVAFFSNYNDYTVENSPFLWMRNSRKNAGNFTHLRMGN